MTQPPTFRAAFVGGVLHGKMHWVPELAPVIFVPAGPREGSQVTEYVRQLGYDFQSKVDDVPSGLYFTKGLDGRSVESLKFDMLWPDGWAYENA